MQNLVCGKFLTFRWLFASNLCIAIASASASTSTVARPSTSKISSRLCQSNQHFFDIPRSAAKMSSGKEAGAAGAAAESYQADTNSVVFVTTPDRETGKKLASSIIERRLAACVNIVPEIESIYLWEGKVNQDSETLLMIKTRTERVDELSKFVRENHPYSVAEVISLPIQNGNLPYLNWITQTVPGRGSKD
ncbi:divalent-cation tolerance protein CutA [Drosophila kikkawai]|uniref:Divalent-cation tolerance protein CutA n=1 Tax=Drosophila kikkawai TaxID=30033 RepID=A0A6P4I846_DROKI|nr:divalent-cation tolerance protein CutA [Drosophila kikkawai]